MTITRAALSLASLFTVALSAIVAAQGGDGSLRGIVNDEQGSAIPGVTVTATSPAQIGQLTAVTNESGLYRFPSVPPGEYRLSYELAGFQNVVREGVRPASRRTFGGASPDVRRARVTVGRSLPTSGTRKRTIGRGDGRHRSRLGDMAPVTATSRDDDP